MPHSTSVRVGGGRRGVEFRHLQKESRLIPSAVNYDWAETSKTGLKVTLWSAPVAAGRFFGLRGLGRCLPCPGPVCTSCFPDLGLTGPISRKLSTLPCIWEAKAVFQGGWFLILIFSHVQPMEYMVIMSDRLEFTVIDSMLN